MSDIWIQGELFPLDELANEMAHHVIVAGLWVGHYYETDDPHQQPEPLDDQADPEHLSKSQRDWVHQECRGFLDMVVEAGLLDEYLEKHKSASWAGYSQDHYPWQVAMGQMGHDLVLTSQGHGAGFWDRGDGELGDKLTALAKTYSEDHFSFTGYASGPDGATEVFIDGM